MRTIKIFTKKEIKNIIKDRVRKIKWDKLSLVMFSLLIVILIFKTFLIPMVMSIVNILLKLVDLYKLLEMPYLFFGSALFLFMGWYIFNIFCNITYWLLKFALTTSVYDSQKKGKKTNNGKTNKI